MSTVMQQEQQTAPEFLSLNGTDYVEFYVGNARQAAFFYRAGLGFRQVAYAGPETGQRDFASYVLQQGRICFVLTTPLRPDNEMAEHIRLHGDGVRDIAFAVDDARRAWKEAVRRGARSVAEPHEVKDAFGSARKASIAIYGDTVHTFVERRNYHGVFLPGFAACDEDQLARSAGLSHIDHVTGNVGWDERQRWAEFYSQVLGFSPYQQAAPRELANEYCVSMSKVMAHGKGRVRLPLNEAAEGQKRSQIEQYLAYNHGPGVQHIALATDDILYTVSRLRANGIGFSHMPHAYYQNLQARIGRIDEPLSELEKLGILIDQDDEGYMLQAFTSPVEDRPTLFFEIIQRKGSQSFGKDNLEALFENAQEG